jgi:hypothetical protein
MAGAGPGLPLMGDLVSDVAVGLLVVPLVVASALWTLGRGRGDRRMEKAAAVVVALSSMGGLLLGVGAAAVVAFKDLAAGIGGS